MVVFLFRVVVLALGSMMCSQDVPAAGELGLEESQNPWHTIPFKKPGVKEDTDEIEEDVEDG